MKYVYLLISLSLCLLSCTSNKEVKALEGRLTELESELSRSQSEAEALKTKIADLESQAKNLGETNAALTTENTALKTNSQELLTELAPYRQEQERLLAIKKAQEEALAREAEQKAKKLQEELSRPIIPKLVDNLYAEPREGKSRLASVQGSDLFIERGGDFTSLFSKKINYKTANCWIEAYIIGKKVQVRLFVSLVHKQKDAFTRDLVLSTQAGYALGKPKTYDVLQKVGDYREIWSWDLGPLALNSLFEEAKSEVGALKSNHPLYPTISFEKNWAALETETALAQYDLSL